MIRTSIIPNVDNVVYFFVEGYFVEDYKVTKMKLKDIKRVWNGKVLT